jgi:ribonuclease HII
MWQLHLVLQVTNFFMAKQPSSADLFIWNRCAIEREQFDRGSRFVVGIDEVGLGCLAGPVVTCAVMADQASLETCDCDLGRVGDSKKLSAKRRGELAATLQACPHIRHVIVAGSVELIDRIGIRKACHGAMRKATEKIMRHDEASQAHVLVDGNQLIPGVEVPQTALVGGDALVYLIGAASILAKVHRDKLMVEAHETYPQYGFDAHKGYGTATHTDALRLHGPCPLHRRSFTWPGNVPVHR